MHLLITLASACARIAHQATGQTRKYNGEPYWHHPARVADLVSKRTANPDMIAAAWLHDVLEDTKVQIIDLVKIFPPDVVRLVVDLTNERPPGINRGMRKALDRNRLAAVSAEAQTIKLADICDNAPSIISEDPEFAKVWLREQHELVPLLNRGDAVLWQMARQAVGLA